MDFSLPISSFTSLLPLLSSVHSHLPFSSIASSLSQTVDLISHLKIFLFSVLFPPLQLTHPFPFLSDFTLSLQFIYPISTNNLFNSISSFQFFLLNSSLAMCWQAQLSHPMAHQHQTQQGQRQTLSSQSFSMSTPLWSENTNETPSEAGLHFTPLPLGKCPNF